MKHKKVRKNKNDVTKKFKYIVSEFISEHADVLKELAKR